MAYIKICLKVFLALVALWQVKAHTSGDATATDNLLSQILEKLATLNFNLQQIQADVQLLKLRQATAFETSGRRHRRLQNGLRQLSARVEKCVTTLPCAVNTSVTAASANLFTSARSTTAASVPTRSTNNLALAATATGVARGPSTDPSQQNKFKDCKELFESGNTNTGVHRIYPDREHGQYAFCASGVTVMQYRVDGRESFDRTWLEYEQGFGEPEHDHWLGLDAMHQLTRNRSCTLEIQVRLDQQSQRNIDLFIGSDGDGEIKWILGSNFSIGPPNDYTLQVGEIDTNLDRKFGPTSLHSHQAGARFTAKDKDLDDHPEDNCAAAQRGGWWHRLCAYTQLNGLGGGADWSPNDCSSDNPVCAYVYPYTVRETKMLLIC